MSRRFFLTILAVALLAALTALPAAALDTAVDHGIDTWRTPGNGQTFADFAFDPIPAGFFCASSQPFTGRIVFRGRPLATRPAGVLGPADTVIERLDDAVFSRRVNPAAVRVDVRDRDGSLRVVGPATLRGSEVATTRIQVKALSLVGVKALRTACGAFRVTSHLVGEQPVTRMVIARDDDDGGRFFAPLSLNVKLVFTPVDGGPAVELLRHVEFPARPDATWVHDPGDEGVRYGNQIRIDTDGDRVVDTVVPGTTNFAAGFRSGTRSGVNHVTGAQIYVPYCGYTGELYAEHCHGVEPVPVEAVY